MSGMGDFMFHQVNAKNLREVGEEAEAWQHLANDLQ